MIQDVALRWFVTVLFGFSAAVCVRAIVTGRHSRRGMISHGLHAVMAVAMAVMAWPRGADLPTLAPMIFFAAAALWFAVITVTAGEHRAANGYHTLMMLAMAWMYAVMGGLPLQKAAQSDMAGMSDMPDMPGMGAASGHAGHAGHAGHGGHGGHGSHAAAAHTTDDGAAWIGVLNWVCAVGFGIAAVFWLYRFITVRVQGRDSEPGQSVGILCQVAMAAGMAIMFAVML